MVAEKQRATVEPLTDSDRYWLYVLAPQAARLQREYPEAWAAGQRDRARQQAQRDATTESEAAK